MLTPFGTRKGLEDVDTGEARVTIDLTWQSNIAGSGNTVVKSMRVLKEHSVMEENVILLNLFCTPYAARTVTDAFPKVSFLLPLKG